MSEVKLNISKQGDPVVNHGIVYKSGEKVVALAVDLDTRYCRVECSGIDTHPLICIESSENHEANSTIIEFPEYAGWSVWTADISKYTLAVCLTRD